MQLNLDVPGIREGHQLHGLGRLGLELGALVTLALTLALTLTLNPNPNPSPEPEP